MGNTDFSTDSEGACGVTMHSASPQATGKQRCCLLVVDAQHDFCEGSLAVPGAVKVAEKIGQLLQNLPLRDRTASQASLCQTETAGCCAKSLQSKESFCEELTSQAAVASISCVSTDVGEIQERKHSKASWCDMVVFSLDWHPPDHVSFLSSHSPECIRSICSCGGVSLSPTARSSASEAVKEAIISLGSNKNWTVVPNPEASGAPGAAAVSLWPPHCVQHTPGAMLHRTISPRIGDFVVRKGAFSFEECFSACGNEGRPTGLLALLKSKNVKTVAICGFCLDYCVSVTALALCVAIPNVVVLTDLTGAINEGKQDECSLFLETRNIRCTTTARFIEEQSRNS